MLYFSLHSKPSPPFVKALPSCAPASTGYSPTDYSPHHAFHYPYHLAYTKLVEVRIVAKAKAIVGVDEAGLDSLTPALSGDVSGFAPSSGVFRQIPRHHHPDLGAIGQGGERIVQGHRIAPAHGDDQGLPLCAAGLPMPLRSTFMKNSHCLVPHRCGSYACPLRYPEQTADRCPVNHKNWTKKGCITTLPLSPGTRIRHQLDRKGDAYKQVYKQRTASERVNSQAVALGTRAPALQVQVSTCAPCNASAN